MEFATDINNVMYAYIDRKKKFPVTTLLRAIGFDNDKSILDTCSILPMKYLQIQVRQYRKQQLAVNWRHGCSALGQKTFVDEDTGEVVTIERNEIILERDVPSWMRTISNR